MSLTSIHSTDDNKRSKYYRAQQKSDYPKVEPKASAQMHCRLSKIKKFYKNKRENTIKVLVAKTNKKPQMIGMESK